MKKLDRLSENRDAERRELERLLEFCEANRGEFKSIMLDGILNKIRRYRFERELINASSDDV